MAQSHRPHRGMLSSAIQASGRHIIAALFEILVLLLASVLLWLRPLGMPAWLGPWGCVVALLATTSISAGDAASSIGDLASPLLFLLVAVPLAVTLDDLGVFTAIAARLDGGRHLAAGLWWFAAAVVVVFNLDAAVVLLTPLYIRIARRKGLNAEALAFQPALLACLASSALPVSNLTNLIAAERLGLSVGGFLTNLAVPSFLATAIGFVGWRMVFRVGPITDGVDDPVDGRALARGLPIIVFLLVGFTLGDVAGIPPWMVATAALGWSSALVGRVHSGAVPRAVVAIVSALSVLVAAAAPHLRMERLFDTSGHLGALGGVAAAAAMSNVANNLPVTMAASASLHHAAPVWPLLIGANIGSVFVITASLSTMLWRDVAAREGVHVTGARWTSVATRVGGPALIVATVALLFSPV